MTLEEYKNILITGTPSDRAQAIAEAGNDRSLTDEEFHELTAMIKGVVRPGRRDRPQRPGLRRARSDDLQREGQENWKAGTDLRILGGKRKASHALNTLIYYEEQRIRWTDTSTVSVTFHNTFIKKEGEGPSLGS